MKRVGTLAFVAAACLLAAAPAAGHTGGGHPSRARRVLIMSLPNVSWADLEGVELPHLERFLDHAAVGDLAARASPVGTSRRPTLLGDGYIALGAGNRAIGDGGVTDGQGLGVDERFGDDTASSVFRRRTGQTVRRGLVQLAIGPIVDRNADLLVDVEPGALGTTLADAGYGRAVIANADGVEPEGGLPVYRRPAVSGLMDEHGVVPAGRLDDGLLEANPRAPYGLQYDQAAVLATFRGVWAPKSVVLVEASDLARVDAYRELATDEQGDALLDAALRRTDALFGELLGEVDLERDAVLVVGPAHPQAEIGLTVAALRAPGVEPGLLRSATTRRSGFVQLIDVAPTVLDLVGIDRPTSMEGRPFEVGDRGGDAGDREDFLVDADAAARFIAERVNTVGVIFVVAHALLVGATLLWLMGRLPPRRAAAGLQLAGLTLLAAVPVLYLARIFPLHDAGAWIYWLFLGGGSVAFAALYRTARRINDLDPLLAAAGVAVAVFVIDALLGTPLQISSALGNSPIVAGRFTGFGNLAFAALSSTGLVLAVLVAGRVGGRRGTWMAAAVLAIVVLADGMPFWGSDVGGVLAMGPAYLVAGALLLGWKLRWRTAVVAVVVTGTAIAAFGVLDLARPAERRTHLGRLLERVADDGWSGFATVIERKLDANLANITNTVWALILPTALILVGYLLLRAPARLRDLERRSPSLRAGAIGAVTLLVLGFALNDSGIRVPALMLVVFDAAVVVLLTSRELATTLPSRDEPAVGREQSEPARA